VHGTVHVARAALQQFRAQGGGRLVLLGSLPGEIATAFMSSYVSAKWAVHGLVRSLRIETRHDPAIHVSLVSPGAVDTPAGLLDRLVTPAMRAVGISRTPIAPHDGNVFVSRTCEHAGSAASSAAQV
jgi:NAD(P)-dependent dehydrogenase (short-subunit alcohol dehydrogenase family)